MRESNPPKRALQARPWPLWQSAWGRRAVCVSVPGSRTPGCGTWHRPRTDGKNRTSAHSFGDCRDTTSLRPLGGRRPRARPTVPFPAKDSNLNCLVQSQASCHWTSREGASHEHAPFCWLSQPRGCRLPVLRGWFGARAHRGCFSCASPRGPLTGLGVGYWIVPRCALAGRCTYRSWTVLAGL